MKMPSLFTTNETKLRALGRVHDHIVAPRVNAGAIHRTANEGS